MGPRARRSSPRATQTRGPTRLDRRHEPARAQPTRRGHVAKQVLLAIGVAQVITRALSRLDEMALREETQTLLRGLDTLSAGPPIGSSVALDPGLEELVHLYRDASPTQRRGMLATVRAWRASPRDAGDPDSSVGGAGE